MAKLLRLRRGTTTQHSTFTGAEGEVTVDTTKDTLVVHDNATAGGRPMLREDVSNLGAGSITSTHIADGTIVNADINASAAIAKTKISGTAITAADTGTVTSTMIADGAIVNADINAAAAIASSKLANTGVTAGSYGASTAVPVLTVNAQGQITAASTASLPSGIVTTSDTGTVTSTMIADGTIVDADINASAAIAKTKISGTAITAADTGTVTNAMLAGSIAASKVSGTAITAADTGTVTNTMLAGSIAASKISGTAITAADSGTVTSTMIADGTIVNADINASAGIAASKISGTAITAADSGTVSSTMLANSSVTKAKLGSDVAKIVQIASYTNSTRTSLTGTSGTGIIWFWQVTFNKLSSTSRLIFTGQLPGHTASAGSLNCLMSYGTSGNFVGWNYSYTSFSHLQGGVIGSSLSGYTTTGSQTLSIGYNAPSGSSGERPFNVWNPTSADDNRLTQCVSQLTVIEVEP